MPRPKPVVQAVSFIRDIHSGLDGPALMDKYRLSKLGLRHALDQLAQHKLVSRDEITRLAIWLEEDAEGSSDPHTAAQGYLKPSETLGPADQALAAQLSHLSEQSSAPPRSSAPSRDSIQDIDSATSSFWITLVCIVLVGLLAWELSDCYWGQCPAPEQESTLAAAPEQGRGAAESASNNRHGNDPISSGALNRAPIRGGLTSARLPNVTSPDAEKRIGTQEERLPPQLAQRRLEGSVRASSLEKLLKSAEGLVFEIFAPSPKEKSGPPKQLALDERASLAVAKADSKELMALLREGARVDARNLMGGTLLMQAAYKGDAKVVSLLLEQGADIDAQGWSGGGALATAAITGRVEVVKLLLEKGAKVDSVDSMGNTPLMLAAISGHESLVPILIDHGAVIDARNRMGMTPLICAAAFGNTAVVKSLIPRGASLDIKDAMGETALSRAGEEGHKRVVKILEAAGK